MKKNKLITSIGVAAVFVALTQNIQAIPVTGNIGFSGAVQLNSGDAQTATGVVGWLGTQVADFSTSGSFSTVAAGSSVTLTAPWSFNSGALNNFWTVGGFTFSLLSSQIYSQSGNFLNVILSGMVTGNGFDTTAFTGTFQVANPSADGKSTFTDRLSFTSASVPDGGTTALLLGLTLAGLVLIKRKNSRGSSFAGAPAQA